MLHSFMHQDESQLREIIREPFTRYLESSINLWKNKSDDLDKLSEEERAMVLSLAFDRYYYQAGFFGTSEQLEKRIRELSAIGITEIACLNDFGVAHDEIKNSLSLIAGLVNKVQD